MKSFLHGKQAIEAVPNPTGATVRVKSAWACAQPQRNEPTVEIVKEGDKVVRLVFVCSCGERTEVECLYPAG